MQLKYIKLLFFSHKLHICCKGLTASAEDNFYLKFAFFIEVKLKCKFRKVN